MAIQRIRIDYTVYPPNHRRGDAYWEFHTFRGAKAGARRLGVGSLIIRNFNQKNKRGQHPGDWWTDRHLWSWDGTSFRSRIDEERL